jgi:hypothetical protein
VLVALSSLSYNIRERDLAHCIELIARRLYVYLQLSSKRQIEHKGFVATAQSQIVGVLVSVPSPISIEKSSDYVPIPTYLLRQDGYPYRIATEWGKYRFSDTLLPNNYDTLATGSMNSWRTRGYN